MLAISDLGDWGVCWPPWDCPPDDSSIIAEMQQLGRVRTTCVIREMQMWAGKFLTIKNMADDYGQPSIATGCVTIRSEIDSVVDYLYGLIDIYFAGEGGRETMVPSSACDGFGITGAAVGAIAAITALLVAGGIVAYKLYIANKHDEYMATFDVCQQSPGSAQCAEAKAIFAQQNPTPIPTDWGKTVTDIAKPVAIAVGIGIIGLLAWKVYERRSMSQPTSAERGREELRLLAARYGEQ